MTFAREAWVFVLPVAVLAVAALLLQWPKSSLALGLLAVLVLAFFRVPSRSFSGSAQTLLAPANGTVTEIRLVQEPLLGPDRTRRITTFLSVFNIHVQRAPADGRVVESKFTPGRKVAAFRPEAGEVNESHFVVVETTNGDRIGIKQIAGLLARRVVSYLETGQQVQRGDLIGVIKFGSRVDFYVPESYEVLVGKGDTVVEGHTPMAMMPGGAGSGS
ncbi:MAG: phosphatidylserine decarboxylase family protein [Acidobacteria bacterium]|nr:phosphatidylserine decarboxylase family protein [Acidobacteriota bacterium]